MSFCTVLTKLVCSKAAKTFYWLVLSIACSIAIVLILLSIETEENRKDIMIETLDFAPKPQHGSVIFYNFRKMGDSHKWEKKIDKFLEPYKKNPPGAVACDFNRTLSSEETCEVDFKKSMSPCISEMGFGYPKAAPCVFIKFKKNLNWAPEFFEREQLNETGLDYQSIEEDFLKNHPEFVEMIWISCSGVTPFDSTLLGTVNYLPYRGFPGYFFPYKGQAGYMEPLVAIHFANPRTGIVIDIRCKIIARNFNETVNFTLLVDDDKFQN